MTKQLFEHINLFFLQSKTPFKALIHTIKISDLFIKKFQILQL